MSQRSKPGKPASPAERPDTVLDTEEEVRQALLSGRKGQPQSLPRAPAPAAAPPPAAGQTANVFRPTARPPVAVLTVLDDGKMDGEVIRIRDHRFVIGRTEGDLRIPIDGRISSRHAEITLQTVGGLHLWVVTDLQSTHGMFVRISRTVLADKAEFLVGNGRYRFEAPERVADATSDYVPKQPGSSETQGWDDSQSPLRPPALTELIGNAIGNRILLVKPEYWIGADPTCQICRADDPFCEQRHVRVFRGQTGAWHAEHNKSQNGLWLRMSQIVVDSVIHFQLGEQRFRLKV